MPCDREWVTRKTYS